MDNIITTTTTDTTKENQINPQHHLQLPIKHAFTSFRIKTLSK